MRLVQPPLVPRNHCRVSDEFRAQQTIVGREVQQCQPFPIQHPEVMRRQVERVGPVSGQVADVFAGAGVELREPQLEPQVLSPDSPAGIW